MAAHQPLLFPSLGPTAFLQIETPDQPSARLYNVVVGHFVGLMAGFFAVWVFGATNVPSVLATHELAAPRVWASVLAVALTLLGGFPPTVRSAVTVMSGVLLIALLGEVLRRLRLKQRAGGSP